MMKKQSGFFLVLLGVMMLVLVGIGSFSVDMGSIYYQQRFIQSAADSASLAAVMKVHTSDATVASEASNLLQLNNIDTSGNGADTYAVACGQYFPASQQFYECPCASGTECSCTSCADANTNAVVVKVKRTVPTYLARVFNITSTSPEVTSVSMEIPSNSLPCIRPFGVDKNAISGVSVGSTFTVGNNSPGNWGRIDIGEGSSGGSAGAQSYENAMETGLCSTNLVIGQNVPPYTGNSNSISTSFGNLVSENDQNGLWIAVVSSFGNGKSSSPTLQEYALVNFISQTGTGQNWQGTFQLVATSLSPPHGGSGAPQTRYLALVREFFPANSTTSCNINQGLSTCTAL